MNFYMSTIAKAGVWLRKTKTSKQNTQYVSKLISSVRGKEAALGLKLPQTWFFSDASL